MRPACFFFFLLIFYRSAGQTVPYERYTTKNGLVSDRVTAIAQDDKGFMWFGSYFGICRYDGTRFEKMSLPPAQQNKYVSFLEPVKDKMYAGFMFSGGLMEYSQGKIYSWFVRGRDSTRSNEFSCMTEEGEGKIILCNKAGEIYRFNKGVFTKLAMLSLPPLVSPVAIRKDRFSNYWIATGTGLFIFNARMEQPVKFFAGEDIYSLNCDEWGRMVLSRSDGKISYTSVINGFSKGRLEPEILLHSSADIKPVKIAGNLSGGQWEISYTNGLTHFRPVHTTESYQTPLDLGTDINIIYIDRESNIWIANEPGVIKIPNFNIQSFRFKETAAGGGSIVKTSDSIVWATNSRSLYCIRGNRITQKNSELPVHDYYGLLFHDKDGYLWVSYWNGGLSRTRWKNGRLMEKKDYRNFDGSEVRVQYMTGDSEGNLWVCGINGIFRIRDGIIQDHYQPLNYEGNKAFIICMSLDESSHTIWLGENARGVITVSYEPGNHYKFKTTGYFATNEGITDNYIRSILHDSFHNTWVGTRSGGIYRLAPGKNKFLACNKEARLGCSRITAITQEDNAVWFAGCDGLYRYHYGNGKWDHFSTSDGILNAEVYNLLAEPSRQTVWTITAEGITELNLRDPGHSVLPLVNITSIQVLGKPDSLALVGGKAKYSYTSNSIGFSFAGASFLDEKKMLYRYMLEGYDHDWSEAVSTNSVNYASLPPGKYVFRVLAANARGQWSAASADFPFEIIIPFYKRPAFIFMVLTLLLFVIYMIRFQRLKNRYRIEKLRFHIARDLHDDIGSTLGSINILSKTAKRRLDKQLAPEEISPIFQKIGESAESTLEAMDDIVWSINPGKDKVEDLLIRIREFAIPLLEARGLTFTISFDGKNEEPLPMDLRRNVFLICKEAVYNVLRHSGARSVEIKLLRSHHYLMLSVTDNGHGFEVGAVTGRNGLKNMQNRAALVNGTLTIDSSSSGTRILLEAPLK